MKSILVGAVAYAPQIVPIWDIIRDYANEYFKDIRLDYVLFSNYERQVQWLLDGKIDIAWNTNVAYIRAKAASNKAKAILLRDTDINFQSVFVSKKDTITSIDDLYGKKFGLGSLDSAQAAIMPLYFLEKNNIKFKEYSIEDIKNVDNKDYVAICRFNSDVGKHGDTGRSEFDVLDKIKSGELDAGAIGSTTWARILQDGSYPDISSFYNTPNYCHCNFTIIDTLDASLKNAFLDMMLSQNKLTHDPKIASMMKLEGLNKWVLCDDDILSGYDGNNEAMSKQNLKDIPKY